MGKAILAAVCFWGVQFYFDQVPGVTGTLVGYIGGHTTDPSSKNVYSFMTGHAEAIEITFNPMIISYGDLLRHFFKMHDPTQLNRQGPDIGDLYRSEIFYFSDEQRDEAIKQKQVVQKSFKNPIATKITAASKFYPAEEYEQKFAANTGIGICHVPYIPLGDKD